MIHNNSYFVEILEREKRDQIQKEAEKAWHLRQLPKKEPNRSFSLDKFLHIRERISLAINSPRFSFRLFGQKRNSPY